MNSKKKLLQLANHIIKRSMTSKNPSSPIISLDKFAWRQFLDPDNISEAKRKCINVDGYTSIPDKICIKKDEFVSHINEELTKLGGESALKNGYADFCKHLFIPNFCNAALPDLKISDSNRHLLRTKYEARRESELPVLVRYFSKEDFSRFPIAEYLDIILYSRKQIIEENSKISNENGSDQEENDLSEMESPWGIVSIKPVRQPLEFPMSPATMLRNALGMEYGGSGVALNREEYNASVAYWCNHAIVQ